MTYFLSGQYNAICDRCGFKFKSSELKKDWQGLMVCEKDFETRHPQTLIKTTTEGAFPEWSRPEAEDVFIHACFIWNESAYAGLGTAGCMKAGHTPLPYETLLELKGP